MNLFPLALKLSYFFPQKYSETETFLRGCLPDAPFPVNRTDPKLCLTLASPKILNFYSKYK